MMDNGFKRIDNLREEVKDSDSGKNLTELISRIDDFSKKVDDETLVKLRDIQKKLESYRASDESVSDLQLKENDSEVTKVLVEYIDKESEVRREKQSALNERVRDINSLGNEAKEYLTEFDFQEGAEVLFQDNFVEKEFELTKKYNLVLESLTAEDKVFSAYEKYDETKFVPKESITKLNDLLVEKIQGRAVSMEKLGLDKEQFKELLSLKTSKEYREHVSKNSENYRKLFLVDSPKGYVVSFRRVKNIAEESDEGVKRVLDDVSKYIGIFELFGEDGVDKLIKDEASVYSTDGGKISLTRQKGRLVFGNNSDGLDEKAIIYDDYRIEFKELDDYANQGEVIEDKYTSAENESSLSEEVGAYGLEYVLDEKVEGKSREELGDFAELLDKKISGEENKDVVKLLETKKAEVNARLEWENYLGGGEMVKELIGKDKLDKSDQGKLDEFVNLSFAKKYMEATEDWDMNYDEEKASGQMVVNSLSKRLDKVANVVSKLPEGSIERKNLTEKLKAENAEFLDMALRMGEYDESEIVVDSKTVTDKLVAQFDMMDGFDEAFEYYKAKHAEIDENHYQSEEIKKGYNTFNQVALSKLSEKLLVLKKTDKVKYLEGVMKLAEFTTDREGDIDSDLVSPEFASQLLIEGMDLPEKAMEKFWSDEKNPAIIDYNKFASEIVLGNLDNISEEDKANLLGTAGVSSYEELLREPKTIQEYSKRYMSLRVIRDMSKGFPIPDLSKPNRYSGALQNKIKDFGSFATKKMTKYLESASGVESLTTYFGIGDDPNTKKMALLLADIQGLGTFDISDRSWMTVQLGGKIVTLIGVAIGSYAAAAAGIAASPFTLGSSAAAGGTAFSAGTVAAAGASAAASTMVSHAMFGKGYDNNYELVKGAGTEFGVNMLGAGAGAGMANLGRVAVASRMGMGAKEAITKGLTGADELAVAYSQMGNFSKGFYYSLALAGDVTVGAALDAAGKQITSKDADYAKDVAQGLSDPLAWVMPISGSGMNVVSKMIPGAKNVNAEEVRFDASELPLEDAVALNNLKEDILSTTDSSSRREKLEVYVDKFRSSVESGKIKMRNVGENLSRQREVLIDNGKNIIESLAGMKSQLKDMIAKKIEARKENGEVNDLAKSDDSPEARVLALLEEIDLDNLPRRKDGEVYNSEVSLKTEAQTEALGNVVRLREYLSNVSGETGGKFKALSDRVKNYFASEVRLGDRLDAYKERSDQSFRKLVDDVKESVEKYKVAGREAKERVVQGIRDRIESYKSKRENAQNLKAAKMLEEDLLSSIGKPEDLVVDFDQLQTGDVVKIVRSNGEVDGGWIIQDGSVETGVLKVIKYLPDGNIARKEIDVYSYRGLEISRNPRGLEFNEVPRQREVITIPDVHGDHDAMINALRSMDVIDANNNWSGGNKRIQFIGDLIDRGGQDKEVFDTIIKLSNQAKESGGHIDVMIGNHELFLFDVLYGSGDSAKRSFSSHLRNGGVEFYQSLGIKEYGSMDAIKRFFFHEKPEYLEFLRSMKAMEQVDDVLYVHAGLPPKWADMFGDYGVDAINQKFWEDCKSGDLTEWTAVGSDRGGDVSLSDVSPLWADFDNLNQYTDAQVAQIAENLKARGVNVVVVGHSRSEFVEMNQRFEEYGIKFINTDASMTRGYGGTSTEGGLRIGAGENAEVTYADQDGGGRSFDDMIRE